MATATKSQGKTSFVQEFLQTNPQGNTESVNEAWTAAGMKGRISHPVVSLVRKQLGLIGNQRWKAQETAKAKSARRMANTTKSENKTGFVKKFLSNNPQGNVKAVNEAWAAAGMKGTIGDSLIYEMRTQMGLSGNLRSPGMPKRKVSHQNVQDSQQSRQVHVRQGVPERQSPWQRQCREQGVGGCRIRGDHQPHPCQQDESIVGSDGKPSWERHEGKRLPRARNQEDLARRPPLRSTCNHEATESDSTWTSWKPTSIGFFSRRWVLAISPRSRIR